MPVGDVYFRAVYLTAHDVAEMVYKSIDPELASALMQLDAKHIFVDIKSIRIDLIRFLVEYIAEEGKKARSDPSHAINCTSQAQFMQSFLCYLKIDENIFRVALNLNFKLMRDAPTDLSDYEICGDIREIPKISANVTELVASLDTKCTLLMHEWTVLQFLRKNNGVFSVNFYNISKSYTETHTTIVLPFELETYIVEVFHGFILTMLAPMMIFCSSDFGSETLASYGYQARNAPSTESAVYDYVPSDIFTTANRSQLYFQHYLPPDKLADLKTRFVHSVSGEPAEVVSRSEVPQRCCIG